MNSRAQTFFSFLAGALLTYASFISPLYANPQGGTVVAGGASISNPNTNTLQIQQSTNNAIINWNSFNIASGETTNILQPSSTSLLLNRVVNSNNVSQIFGQLNANGRVIIVNPAGIYFGPTARINVNGLIATTADINNNDFMAGNLHFVQAPNTTGMVINEGTITAAAQGLVALVAPAVRNSGIIQANLGQVALASGNEFTVDLYGDNLINFAVNPSNKVTQAATDTNGQTVTDAVNNTGSLIANGGTILLTANVAQNVVQNVIDMKGVAQAQSVSEKNGEIILSGGDNGTVQVSGKLDVSGKTAGATGGTVKVLGQHILLSGAQIDASGDAGGGNVIIGGDLHGQGPDPDAQAVLMDPTSQINASAITNGNGGQITVWSNDYTNMQGTLLATGGAEGGNGGYIETSSAGLLNVNNGYVNASAPNGAAGMWLLDPYNVSIVSSTQQNGSFSGGNPDIWTPNATSSQVLASNIDSILNGGTSVTITTSGSGSDAGNITVGAAISWTTTATLTLTATNAIAINNSISGTSGTLQLSAAAGSVSSPTITATAAVNVDNFILQQGTWQQISSSLPSFSATNNFEIQGSNSIFQRFNNSSTTNIGTVSNPYSIADIYGLQGIAYTAGNAYYALANNIDASVTANWNNGAGFVPIGLGSVELHSVYFHNAHFNGNNYTINNLTINLPSTGEVGLFGSETVDDVISNVGLINANVTGNGTVGALVGYLAGGSVSNAYSSGTVTALEFEGGGLIGQVVGATITNSYSTAAVYGGNGAGDLGGLAGLIFSGTSISNSYATGNIYVKNGSTIGGFVGENESSNTISNSYSTGAVIGTGNTDVGGFVGDNDSSTITNSFWDTATSGLSAGVGSNVDGGTITNLTGGCFTGVSCANGGTADLSSLATYPSADGWSIADAPSSSTWGIIPGVSYPYLTGTFSGGTPQVISGTVYSGFSRSGNQGQGTSATAGQTVYVAVNGASAMTTGTGANGAYYGLVPNGTFSNGSILFAYLPTDVSNNTVQGNTLMIANGSNATGLTIYGNSFIVRSDSLSNIINNSTLTTALSDLTDGSGILYDLAGNNLILNGSDNFITWGGTQNGVAQTNTTYSLNDNITTNGGNVSFYGPVNLTNNILLTAGAGNISFFNTLDGADALTISASGGSSALWGNVGGNTPLSSLSITDNQVSLQGNTIVTSGDQNYNAVNLNSGTTTFNTNNGSINFNSTITGNTSNGLTLTAANGNINFFGAAGSTSNRLGTVNITNAVNVTEHDVLKVLSFIQQNGSGTTNFGNFDVDASNIIYVKNNYIEGLIIGGNATLIGLQGINAQISVNSLTVGGNNGGYFTSDASDIYSQVNNLWGINANSFITLLPGASGAFYIDNFPIGGPTNITNSMIYSSIPDTDAASNGTIYPSDYSANDTPEQRAQNTVIMVNDNSAMAIANLNICK